MTKDYCNTHETRYSDSSLYDEVCKQCGATDVTGDGWDALAQPCPKETDEHKLTRMEKRQTTSRIIVTSKTEKKITQEEVVKAFEDAGMTVKTVNIEDGYGIKPYDELIPVSEEYIDDGLTEEYLDSVLKFAEDNRESADISAAEMFEYFNQGDEFKFKINNGDDE